MIPKRTFKREMMMRKIKRVYGHRSMFVNHKSGYAFKIVSEANGIPTHLQTIHTRKKTREEAVEVMFNMARENQGTAYSPVGAVHGINPHSIYGET